MIKTENIEYVYGKGLPYETHALKNVSLEIPDGSITAIIGHTGSGKSTLIQMFNALIRPDSGRILINGCDITDKKADLKEIRKKVGLVFQYPEHQLFEETVYKDIAFGPKNMGLSAEEIKVRVHRAMNLAGIDEEYAECSPFELSGGQKRRAAIAGVLAMEPEVLILDEPAAGLDPQGRNEMLATIKSLHDANPEMIIIFVSHSMEDVAAAADNIIVMNDGEIEMCGNVREIFSRSERLNEIGLDVPQITRLMMKLNILGYHTRNDIFTVSEAASEIKKLLGGSTDD